MKLRNVYPLMNGAAKSNNPPPPVRGPHNFHLNSPIGGQESPIKQEATENRYLATASAPQIN